MAEASPTENTKSHDDMGLTNDIILNLAPRVPHERYHIFGDKLGFDVTWLNNLLYKHHRDVEKATVDLLMAWKTKHGDGPDKKEELDRILASAGLASIASHKAILIPDMVDMMQETDRDIYAKKITDNLTVGMCRNKLINRYKTRTCKVQIKPWDRSSVADVKDIFTVVTMYKKDADGKNLGEHEKVTLQGSVNDIFTTKVNGMLPYRIVIFAGAGKGKTTSVAKMAYDWAYSIQGSPLQDLPLLFILRLRDIQPQTSLGQAIISELLNDIQDLTPEALETFIRKNQKICWLILDGLDEYSGSIVADSNLKSNIVQVLTNLDLSECRVLVTSRPHLEKDFDQGDLPIIYARMEIEGFSRLNSRAYIDRFFIGDSKGNDLKAYLDRNDVINELVSTPLFCLMVCYLWREELLSNLDTQTGLLDSVNSFLLRHAQRRSPDITQGVLDKTLLQLGRVALDGLLNDKNKLVFYIEDFAKVPRAIDIGCELGLISKTTAEGGKPTFHDQFPADTTIEFYHKLAQEHTAGKYLAKSFNTFWRWFKASTLDGVLRKISKHIGDFDHLLRFTAGTNNHVCMRVLNEILASDSVTKTEKTRIILECFTESAEVGGDISSVVEGCVHNGTVILKSPTVYTAAGLKKMPRQLRQKITSVEIMNPRLAAALSRTLSDGLQSLPGLQRLAITKPVIAQELPRVTSIKDLKLESIPRGCSDWEWLREVQDLETMEVTLELMEGSWAPYPQPSTPSLSIHPERVELRDTADELADVFLNLPETVLNEIAAVEVKNSHHVLNLPRALTAWVRTLPKLQRLTVKEHVSVKTQPDFDDWSWLRELENLEEVNVSLSMSRYTYLSHQFQSSLSIRRGEGHISSATKYLSRVFQNVPYTLLKQLTSVKITNSNESPNLPRLLTDCLQSLRKLQRLSITTSVPLVASQGHHRVPPPCDEWAWLRELRTLEEIMALIILRDSSHQSPSSLTVRDGEECLKNATDELGSICQCLPDTIIQKIQRLRMVHCQLSEERLHQLWTSLRLHSSVSQLTVERSSFNLPVPYQPLTSVWSLIARGLTPSSLSCLLASLPCLTKIVLKIEVDLDKTISLFVESLQQNRHSLQNISIVGIDMEKRVSSDAMARLCDIVRKNTASLQEIHFSFLSIGEDSLVEFIECCRGVVNMMVIGLWFYGRFEGGNFHKYLKDLHCSEGTIAVEIKREYGKFEGFKIPH